MDDKISILIPAYNVERYIEKLLNSIKNQTYKNYEVIISDDCSQDNTVKIIENFCFNNQNISIKLLKNNQNLGLSKNRNNVLENAKGKWITFVDSDDYIEEEYLELLINTQKKNNADLVIGELRRVDDKGNIIQNQLLPLYPSKWLNGSVVTCLFRKDIIEKYNLRFKMETCSEDGLFCAQYNYYIHNVAFARRCKL